MTLLEILAYFAAICRCANTQLFHTDNFLPEFLLYSFIISHSALLLQVSPLLLTIGIKCLWAAC